MVTRTININHVSKNLTNAGSNDHEHRQMRIINGQDSSADEHPYVVMIIFCPRLSTSCNQCGGAIIHQEFIITAAHCLDDNHVKLYVRLMYDGPKDRRYYQYGLPISKTSSKNERVIVHPEFSRQTVDNDIALIHMPELALIVKDENILNLPNSMPAVNQKVVVAGWGWTDPDIETLPDYWSVRKKMSY